MPSKRVAINAGFTLDNAEKRAAEAPSTFEIPDRSEREHLQPGDLAKLIFAFPEGPAERMWVTVTAVKDGGYLGKLRNKPLSGGIRYGKKVAFGPEHVADISYTN
jgi:hypothetical protein